jgi:hypothetical protein
VLLCEAKRMCGVLVRLSAIAAQIMTIDKQAF